MPCPACTSGMIRAALAAIVPIRLVAPVVGVPVKEVGAGRRPLVRARFGVRWRVRIGATVEVGVGRRARVGATVELGAGRRARIRTRSEEHTSELRSHLNLVCRLLLEKKKKRG